MAKNQETLLRKFHQAKWDEEIIYQMSVPGERGILVPQAEEPVQDQVGNLSELIPDNLLRKVMPNLPEINQMRSPQALCSTVTGDLRNRCQHRSWSRHLYDEV